MNSPEFPSELLKFPGILDRNLIHKNSQEFPGGISGISGIPGGFGPYPGADSFQKLINSLLSKDT